MTIKNWVVAVVMAVSAILYPVSVFVGVLTVTVLQPCEHEYSTNCTWSGENQANNIGQSFTTIEFGGVFIQVTFSENA